MNAHRIRLRGFWETTPVGDSRVRHVRRFGRPRALASGETVWVVGDPVPGAVVSVNGVAVGAAAAGPWAFDVTALLQPRNELAIEAAGPIGEVAVEVRSFPDDPLPVPAVSD